MIFSLLNKGMNKSLNSLNIKSIFTFLILLTSQLCRLQKLAKTTIIRVRPRFFDQVGHETMNASTRNKHFSQNLVFVKLTKIMNRVDKNWAQF